MDQIYGFPDIYTDSDHCNDGRLGSSEGSRLGKDIYAFFHRAGGDQSGCVLPAMRYCEKRAQDP